MTLSEIMKSLQALRRTTAHFRRAVFAFSLTAPCVGCHEPGSAPDSIEGDYRLVAVNGIAVPADWGPVLLRPIPPDTNSISGPCRMLLSAGLATIDNRLGTFHLEWVVRNSCTGAVLSTMREDGHFTQAADSMTFVVKNAVPPDFIFRGTADGVVLVVSIPDLQLSFSR
jgi:hypothetical protein